VLKIPKSEQALLLRTDYSDQAAWAELVRLVEAPYTDGFRAYLTFVDEPQIADKSLDELMTLVEASEYRSFFFVADREAIIGVEHAVIVVDLVDQRGRNFRVIPSQMWSVENNLSLANLDFSDFLESTDSAGVYRGFRD
jgi:hypothetical protein